MTFDPMRAELRQQVRITSRRSALEWERQVRQNAPVVTGDLRDSVRMRDTQTVSGALIEGEATVDYAEFVSGGTRPHRIVARNARALRFPWRGAVVYFRSVNHPGTQPNDFWTRPLRQLPDTIRRIWFEVTR